MYARILLACCSLLSAGSCTSVHSAKHSRVWGSGIDPRVNTPARYVHVAVYNGDTPVTKSLGKHFITVNVVLELQNGRKSTVRVKEYDRGDGTYTFQYFFNTPAKAMTVTVRQTATNEHVGSSPYTIRETIITETCDCPRPVTTFQSDFGCRASDPAGQIDVDMAKFGDGVTRKDFEHALEKLDTNGSSVVHFSIIDNKIYSKVHGPFGGFQKFFNDMLFSLRRKVLLPDMEFLLNMGDWPQSPKVDELTRQNRPPFPMFSWCGSDTHHDMVLPTYKIVQATVFGKDLENVQETDGTSYMDGGEWASKQDVIYFRGRPSNAARTQAMHLAEGKSHMDIKISKNHFNYFPNEEAKIEHREWEKQHGKKVDRDKFSAAFKNKYQLNIDGTVAAYRLPALIAGNSVVLKQDSDYYEHFYKAMKPWVHYVPLTRTLSDLEEKYDWLKSHDRAAKQISTNARILARKHLRVEDIYCYHIRAFERFAALQKFTPKVWEGMTEQTDSKAETCQCPKYPVLRPHRGKRPQQGPKDHHEL